MKNIVKLIILIISFSLPIPSISKDFDGIFLKKQNNKDWLILTSDDLLFGEIVNLYENNLEFKTKNLGTLNIAWSKIKSLESHRKVNVGFTDLNTKKGILRITDGKAYLGNKEFDPDTILTIMSNTADMPVDWYAKIALGANFYSGNSDQFDYTAIINLKRRTTESRIGLNYIGNYSKNGNESSVNNHRINTNFDWFLSKRFYLRPIAIDLYKDPFVNIDYQYSINLGVGYNIFDEDHFSWTVNIGPGFTQTRYKHSNTKTTESSAALVLSSSLKKDITDDIEFKTKYRMQISDDKTGLYTHHASAALKIELTDIINLNTAILWDHISKPNSDNNTQLKKNDYQYIIGFEVEI